MCLHRVAQNKSVVALSAEAQRDGLPFAVRKAAVAAARADDDGRAALADLKFERVVQQIGVELGARSVWAEGEGLCAHSGIAYNKIGGRAEPVGELFTAEPAESAEKCEWERV